MGQGQYRVYNKHACSGLRAQAYEILDSKNNP